eukprot:3090091-Amphidinium_carterae.1
MILEIIHDGWQMAGLPSTHTICTLVDQVQATSTTTKACSREAGIHMTDRGHPPPPMWCREVKVWRKSYNIPDHTI